jgi:soluble lytic murein transglycosylase
VTEFRDRWSDSPLANRLFNAWLDAVFRRGRYADFVAHYEGGGDAARTCQYLRSLERVGRLEEAMAGVTPVWLNGRSQPDVCDPLFKRWIEERHLTRELVWQRLTLAVESGQTSLARYLTRYLEGRALKRADAFIAVSQRPTLVVQTSQYRADDRETRAMVSLGVRRLARSDPEAAFRAWTHYRDTLTFDVEAAREIDQEVTRFLARRGILVDAPELSPTPNGRHLDAAEALVVTAIGRGEPLRALEFLDALRAEDTTDPRWSYWRGRAQRAAGLAGGDAFDALSRERHYYGFLAADILGREPQLNARVLPDDPDAAAAIGAHRGMQRVRELYAVGDTINARREWLFLAPHLDERGRLAAVTALQDMGWIDLSVIASADLTDYLELRFPAPHRVLFDAASHATALPLGFLYGVARQESAFGAAAVSPAGALGLMQLMPDTAARTARGLGLPVPTRADLLHPDVNVRLGTRHLATLMKRYDGNRFLSAAAYNAGEHRVDRWLRERPLGDADVWIDSIPFLETRNYVKAVLAFSYIYGQKLGKPAPFLTDAERGGLRNAVSLR